VNFRIPLLAVSALLVAACGGGGPAPQRPAEDSTATRAPAIAAPEPAEDGLVADAVGIKDPKSDLRNADGKKIKKRVPHIDITRLSASADGTDLRITLRLAGDVPREMASFQQELNYLVVLEADKSGENDYWLMLTNLEAGSWSPALSDWATNYTKDEDEFPGTFVVADNEVSFIVSLSALGSPTSLRLSAITQKADHETGDVEAEDQVPKGEQYVPAKSWLTLAP
jgi:hypothetical protein